MFVSAISGFWVGFGASNLAWKLALDELDQNITNIELEEIVDNVLGRGIKQSACAKSRTNVTEKPCAQLHRATSKFRA